MDARDVLDEFLWNIKIDDIEEAKKYVQLTFKKQHTNKELCDWIEAAIPFVLKDYNIVGLMDRKDLKDDFKDNMLTYVVKLKDNRGNDFTSYANVIREKKAFLLSKKGKWGVNPISVIPKDLRGNK